MIETVPGPRVEITFKGNKGHPERVIEGLFRAGPYLNLPSEIPTDFQRSARELIELYQPHVTKYGEDSLAQLCPTKHDFEVLTKKGIDLVCLRTKAKATFLINTIDQLRGLYEVLEGNPSIRVFVHEPSNGTRIRMNLKPLRDKLDSRERSFNGQRTQEMQ